MSGRSLCSTNSSLSTKRVFRTRGSNADARAGRVLARHRVSALLPGVEPTVEDPNVAMAEPEERVGDHRLLQPVPDMRLAAGDGGRAGVDHHRDVALEPDLAEQPRGRLPVDPAGRRPAHVGAEEVIVEVDRVRDVPADVLVDVRLAVDEQQVVAEMVGEPGGRDPANGALAGGDGCGVVHDVPPEDDAPIADGIQKGMHRPPTLWSETIQKNRRWARGDSNSGPPPCQGDVIAS